MKANQEKTTRGKDVLEKKPKEKKKIVHASDRPLKTTRKEYLISRKKGAKNIRHKNL